MVKWGGGGGGVFFFFFFIQRGGIGERLKIEGAKY
jgi:hypothetical protein